MRHPVWTHHRVDDGAAHHKQTCTGAKQAVNSRPGGAFAEWAAWSGALARRSQPSRAGDTMDGQRSG